MARPYKKGPSDWWRPYTPLKATGIPDEADKAMMAFKGFISGEMFVTKKGNRGQKMESNWARYLLQAFETDDDELVKISSESKIFDLACVVVGGDVGSPYSIGQLGFYAGNQLEIQVSSIQNRAKALNDRAGNNFLSDGDWNGMKEKFRELVVHIETPRFTVAHRGDSFAALAIYKNAFVCAKLLIDLGVDPMKPNEKDQDLFIVTFNQYHVICEEMKHVLSLKDESTKRVFTPTEDRDLIQREATVVDHFKKMRVFICTISEMVQRRLRDIERDKTLLKIATMRGSTISKEQMWNIEQENKIIHHVHETTNIVASIDEKLKQYDRIQKSYVSMAVVFNLKHKELMDAMKRAQESVVVVVDPKEERLRAKREKEMQRKLDREKRSKEREDKRKEEADAEVAKEADPANKDRYEGERDHLGNMHGKGILRRDDGSRYEGAFDTNDIHGKGVLKFPNGDLYEGTFNRGQMSGKGTMKYVDLTKFDGDWVDGKRHGKGICEFSNGSMFMGDYENDVMSGRGFMQYTAGETYDGEWKNDKREGKGIYTDIHQAVFDCEWVNDVQEGLGSVTYPEGNIYEGGFANGQMHGQCKFTYTLGGYVYEGPVDHGTIKVSEGPPIPIESWLGPRS